MATLASSLRRRGYPTHQAFSSPSTKPAVGAGRCSSHGAATHACHASRRQILQGSVVLTYVALGKQLVAPAPSKAADGKLLCDEACQPELESKELVTTPSGLQYRDLVVGRGPSPPVGFQVVTNYVAMTPKLKVFDSSLDRGTPFDIRVGTGQIVAGLDEGMLTMKPGGIRRLYIPGPLAFPKGLRSAAGRPAVPPNSPVIFDVQLLYIPGLEDDEE